MKLSGKDTTEAAMLAQKYRVDAKMREKVDFYLTEEGYRCFTERYHLKRGYCCQSGCRHCPYGYNKNTNI